jgi:cytochrome c5
MFSLILGVLVGIAVVIFVLSSVMGRDAQEQILRQDPQVVEATLDRIKPIARVAIAGEAEEIFDPVVPPQLVETLLTGPQVYNTACQACHASGVGGAPMLGDSAAWMPRVAQGKDVLSQHVLEGYQGEVGYMPPKGGRIDLSDQEVLDALEFMLADL